MTDNQESPSKEFEQKGCTLTLEQVRAIHQYRDPEIILELAKLKEQLTTTQQALDSAVEALKNIDNFGDYILDIPKT